MTLKRKNKTKDYYNFNSAILVLENKSVFKGIGIATIGALVLSPDTLFMRWSEMDAWSMLTWRGFEMGLMLILFSSCFRIYRENFKKVFSRVGIWIILSQILSSIFFTYGVAETSVSLILFCLATSPIFASIFSIFILREKTTSSTWITAFFALIGEVFQYLMVKMF